MLSRGRIRRSGDRSFMCPGVSNRRCKSGERVYLCMMMGDFSGESIRTSRGGRLWKSGDFSGEMLVSRGSGVKIRTGLDMPEVGRGS